MFLEIALVLPFVLLIALFLAMPNAHWNMDQGEHRGSFFPLLAMYLLCGFFISGASLAMALHVKGEAAQLFLVAASDAMIFNVLMLYFYESYLHAMAATGKSNYTTIRYSWVLALGMAMVVTFIGGMVMVAL